jgi:hypothetical protein
MALPTDEELTPALRIEIQHWRVRSWWARRRRRLFEATRSAPARKRYDMAGRLIGVGGQSCAPRLSSWAEDRS